MANQEQLDLLKKSVQGWNAWRKEHPNIIPDLNHADLSRANLNYADLSLTNLIDANLRGADLVYADFRGASLQGADFEGAHLEGASLRLALLGRANLSFTDLTFADFSSALFNGTNLSNARLSRTVFNDVDLRPVKGLKTLHHVRPSTLGIDTIYNSQGDIPEIFLKGVGVDDTFITYIQSLVGRPIEYYSCFISYSSKDDAFARRLYADLQSNNVRCWFAPEDMKTGDEIRSRIDEAIRIHDKLLLVLSEHSVSSSWVKKEVETAFEKEDRQQRLVLFPVRLDDAVMQTGQAWAADIRRMRHITDFTGWKNHDEYQMAFNRLLHDLKTETPKTKEL